jgi:Mn-containing catalase
MFLHNTKMMFPVRIDEPNPEFAKMLLEQFGGPNGELGAAMRYFTQGWAESDGKRRDMLLDIATEELSHLEMVGQMLVQLLRGSPAAKVDEVEGSYLGELLDGNHEKFIELSLCSAQNVTGGPGPKLTDSMGNAWTADWVDTIGEPTADLRSDIAAEARAKIVYERLIKLCTDAGAKETLGFLMTREIAHLKQFEAALDAITQNFPPGKLPGGEPFDHLYFIDNDSGEKKPQGFELAASSPFGFESKTADEVGEEPPPIDPRPTLASKPAKSHNGHAAHSGKHSSGKHSN